MATITDQDITANLDDCVVSSNSFINGGSSIGAGQWAGLPNISGLRYRNISIPKNATIISATLKIRAASDLATTTCNTKITAEAADSPADFGGLNLATFLGRHANQTTAYVYWDDIAAWTAGTDYISPDISSVIQEIVNRAGWSENNSIVFFWDDDDDRSDPNVRRIGKAYGVGATTSPPYTRLSITYTSGGRLVSINII